MKPENPNNTNLSTLKAQLKETLDLDLEDFGLDESQLYGFSSNFIGINLQSAFQAIYNIEEGDLLGYEALLRPNLGNIKEASPEFAFSYAEAAGKLVKLDRISRTLHVLNFNQIFQEKGLLFLNVHPNLLISVNEHGRVFEKILHSYAVPTSRVVIEIKDFSRQETAENLNSYEKQLAAAIENYHDRGYQIAIDNFGNTHSIVNRLWKLKPDYVKFDRSLLNDIQHQPRQQAAIKGLIDLIVDLEAQPIVTGIESQTELDIVTGLGARYLQGYYLGKPLPAKQLYQSDVVPRH